VSKPDTKNMKTTLVNTSGIAKAKRPAKKANIVIAKSPLKWAGGKRLIVSKIAKLIGKHPRERLIEPFVGGGSVFLNLDFDAYLLADTNPDLINLFNQIKHNLGKFIELSQTYFSPEFNNEARYYETRQAFNTCREPLQRAALFLYLNRHGYNGLCRYNQKGEYNVPFGRYKKPYFPALELGHVQQRTKTAEFVCGDFSVVFEQAQPGDLIYCDPPYTPRGKTASFTAYSGTAFQQTDQLRLIESAMLAKERGITTIIANHSLPETLKMYAQADKIVKFDVARMISCKGEIRKPCEELMAIYKA
jgi:DNA adenine methylase